MASYLVTGSSRGVGLAIVTALASKPASDVAKVFAAARSETENLKHLVAVSNGRVVFLQLDVILEESIKKAADRVSEMQDGKGIDVLINNAGIMDPRTKSIELMTNDHLDQIFKVNVGGVHSVTRTFLPELRKGSPKKIINISSTLGSISMASASAPFGVPSYKISKAALNMLTVNYAMDLANEDFGVIAINPGWIRTDLGTSAADLSPEEGAEATLNVVFRVNSEETGKFFTVRVPGWENKSGHERYDGNCPPW
ncbi:hypothetical protein SLS56_006442 [Neofusicoccum ribis]|uniref:Short chain oxidoreductase n=1 Tax=Neofusicoccum ribis TaxID=45134 RepID=A0ABR3SQN5_9PEZI